MQETSVQTGDGLKRSITCMSFWPERVVITVLLDFRTKTTAYGAPLKTGLASTEEGIQTGLSRYSRLFVKAGGRCVTLQSERKTWG
jgi:hypothetical protein